jgi:ABC-2 type transport system permease protein
MERNPGVDWNDLVLIDDGDQEVQDQVGVNDGRRQVIKLSGLAAGGQYIISNKMRILRFLLQKEFRQIFRDKSILRIIFVMPIIQLLILPWAADYEVKDINLAVVDHDHSDYSRQLVGKVTASGYFRLQEYTGSYAAALSGIEKDRSDLILEIPAGFEKQLVKEDEATLFMAINAINGVKANLGGAYLRSIIQDYNREVRTEWIQFPRFSPETNIVVTSSNWFNPLMNYKYFMVPGILVILVTLVGSFLSSLNIVKEKEIGTIEQINVTPVKKYQFILGKLIPFWLLGLLVLTIGLLISRFAYGILPEGNMLTIYVFAAVYLLAVLGLGLLVSTYTSTQQQAMLISFFMMMVFILLGGLYTSIDSMPGWAQVIAKINPVTYFIEVMRMVVLKGSGLGEIRNHILTMLGFAIVLNGWAVVNYRKRS